MNRIAMKNRISIIITMLIIVIGNYYAIGQEQLSRKQQADRLFDRYEYYNASRLYLILAEKKHPDVKVLKQLATCYRMMNEYSSAETWYAKVIENPKSEPLDHFYYGEILQRNQKFEEAKEQYTLYGVKSGKPQAAAIKIVSCDSAASWIKKPTALKIKNAQSLNSKYSDWGANFYGNEGLVFTSDRTTETGRDNKDTYAWTGNSWLKLYLASLKEEVEKELPVVTKQNFPSKVDYHVGPLVLSPTGDTAYVTIATRTPARQLPIDKSTGKKSRERLYTRRLEIIVAIKKEGSWQDLKGFTYNNVKEFSVGHAAISKNGNVMYFTSDMPGGMGKTDIWYCIKQADGQWGPPANCGPEINTSEEEAFPTISGNGDLYYASKGKVGLGGYDIYTSKGSGAQWTKSVNLKYPANSTSDDFYFVSLDGKSGYLSSNREGGAGDDDIYSFNEEAVQQLILALEGTVSDVNTKLSLDSVLVVLKNAQGVAINQTVTGSGGSFFFDLEKDKDYNVEFSKPHYSSATIPVSTRGINKSDTLNIQAFLKKDLFELGKTYVLKNIYYDFDKSNIRPDAAKELDKLIVILKENPEVHIELGSHTDSRGKAQYNQWLSQKRANSAVQYMLDRGIQRNRITAKGYGETMLLNKCADGVKCTEAAHQLNRRTEFKSLK